VPKLRRRRPQPRPRPAAQLPPGISKAQREAAGALQKGLDLGMVRATVVLPQGLGDGGVGARVLEDSWRRVRGPQRRLIALVVTTEAMFPQVEARYRKLGGDGLFVIRAEPNFASTDTIARALKSCQGLIVLSTYADIRFWVMAMRRTKSGRADFVIFEMANAALGMDGFAHEAVFNWKARYMVPVGHSVYVTSKSLEDSPVRGLGQATMQVPSVPIYTVVSQPGGPCGPELYYLPVEEAQRRGITLRVKILPLDLGGEAADAREAALELARLHRELGLAHVELAASDAAAAAAALDTELQRETAGACRAVPLGTGLEEPPQGGGNALFVYAADVEPLRLVHALGRLAFQTGNQDALYMLVPSESGAAAAAGWRALVEHDESVKLALRSAAVELGRVGHDLTWQDLPPRLRDVLADVKGRRQASRRAWVEQVVNGILAEAADEWDIWYGRLLAYRAEHANETVPITATVHGQALGQWVARQFLEWRWGGLSAERRERLLQGGLSLEEEKDRYFADGLEEFSRHVEDQHGDPHVPKGHFTPSGFPLGAWATAQRAAWRKGRLTVEQQYLLDAATFSPVAHPDNSEAREVTMMIRATLYEHREHSLQDREKCFRRLVVRYHPTSSRMPHSEEVTMFLAGYRDWFLEPPLPPVPEGE